MNQNISAVTQKTMLSYNKRHSVRLQTIIDDLTPCLRHRLSGEAYDTAVSIFTNTDVPQTHQWNFDWGKYAQTDGYEVYKLLIRGQDRIQGLVYLEPQVCFCTLSGKCPLERRNHHKRIYRRWCASVCYCMQEKF